MPRRSGLAASLAQYQRQVASAQAAQLRAHTAAQREAERARKAYERALAADERERKRLYLESRAAEVDAMNEALNREVALLEGLLEATLSLDDYIDFDSLKTVPDIPPFDPATLGVPEPRPDPAPFAVPPLGGARKLLPGAKQKHAAAVVDSNERYQAAETEHVRREEQRLVQLELAKEEHEKHASRLLEQAAAANKQVESFRAEFEAGDPDAIVSYFDMVLQRSTYPTSFPRHFRLAYVPESRQLVVELQLPTAAVVPEVKAYKFVKTKDEVTSTPRPASQVKSLYTGTVAQMTLRTLHELFEADRKQYIDTLVLNCYVDTQDPATGKAIRPTLISLRTTRQVVLGYRGAPG